jgi:hypothetical protein
MIEIHDWSAGTALRGMSNGYPADPHAPAFLAATGGIGTENRIETETGEVSAARLRAGDRIVTREGINRPLLDVLVVERGASTGATAAVVIPQGALGPELPEADLVLAADQAILVTGPKLHLVTGEDEGLLVAADLVGKVAGVVPVTGPKLLIRLVFEATEIISIDGLWVEAAPHAAPGFGGPRRLNAQEALRLLG